MKILFVTNVPSPYRVDFFNELGKSVDLTVAFEKKRSTERKGQWKENAQGAFKAVFMKGISVSTDHAFCLSVKKIIKKGKFDFIIISDYTSPTGILAARFMRKKGISYFLESDGGLYRSGGGIKDRIKKYVFCGAAGFFSPRGKDDGYFTAYGVSPEKIIRYPFTSAFEKDLAFAKEMRFLPNERKEELKKKLGITEKRVILSVGRFTYLNGYGKGYDVLIKAAGKIASPDVGFYIVGGEPTEEFKKITAESGLKNIHYVDYKDKTALSEYYAAADLFVLMTIGDVWGLVINEAAAFGLPIITTDKCVAGLELVKDGENGFIVKTGDDNALKEKIDYILSDEKIMDSFGRSSLEKIKNYSIEKMAAVHIAAIESYLKSEKAEND